MDLYEFLTQLDISTDANINELPEQFARVLSWMCIDPFSEPDAPKINLILRAALFLYGNLELHGHTLEQKLKECRSIPKNELNSVLSRFHAGTLLSDACEQLLMTVTGPDHILEIQSFCLDFLDGTQFSKILFKVRELRCSQRIEDRVHREAKFLIITTFQLPAVEIERTIERIVDNVEFDILAWIITFQEPQTFFAMKCVIVQKELCLRLQRGLVSRKFIASMYAVCAFDEDGLRTYFKCLQNSLFADSLMTFCISYLSIIGTSSPSEEQSRLMEHDIHNVSFLIAGMMSKKSECRLEFHKKLAAISVNVNVLFNISHLNFIYNF